jgi:hypothetical protein
MRFYADSRSVETQVDICESRTPVCIAACRSEALRDRTRTATLVASLYR